MNELIKLEFVYFVTNESKQLTKCIYKNEVYM